MAEGISVKIPFFYDEGDGPYGLNKTLPEAVKQNFKHLVLTTPGEKPIDPEFGVGVYRLLFENATGEIIGDLEGRIIEQANKYMPFVDVINVSGNFFENRLDLSIKYFIKPLGMSEVLSLNLTTDTE